MTEQIVKSRQVSGVTTRSGSTTDGNLVVWNGNNADSIKDGGAVPSVRTLIAEILPAGTATISFTSIPATFKNLELDCVLQVNHDYASSPLGYILTINSDTTDSNYDRRMWGPNQWGISNTGGTGRNHFIAQGTEDNANTFGDLFLEFPQYANTGFFHWYRGRQNYKWKSAEMQLLLISCQWRSTAAINRIDIATPGGYNYSTNSVARLYGIP